MHQRLVLRSSSRFSEKQSILSLGRKENEARLFYYPESFASIIEAKCATGLVCWSNLHAWIDEQITAKEEVMVEEGADMQSRTQVLEIIFKGFDVYCLMF